MQPYVRAARALTRRYPLRRGRSRLARLLTTSLHPPRYSEAVDPNGYQLTLDLQQQPSRLLFWFGEWEEVEMAHVLPLLRDGAIAVDIGANVGITSLSFARAVAPAGHVYAFEPDPNNLTRLEENLARNGMSSLVSVHAMALSSDEGEIVFNVRPDGSHSRLAAADGDSGTAVATTRLDSFVAGHGIVRLDLVKLDVEGAEALVLEGAREVLRTLRPAMLIEIDDHHLSRYDTTAASLVGTLKDLGYALFELEGAPRSTPFRSGDISPRNVLAVPVDA